MPHHELDAASMMIAAIFSIATPIVNADARAVRGAAPESIQSFDDRRPSQDDIDIDVDPDWDPSWSRTDSARLRPATSLAAGSVVYALPTACIGAGRLGATYYNCDGVWYEPRFAGVSITYMVVNPPPQIASSLLRDDLAPQSRRER
ncbi:MAG TPA: hypothetical protein VFO00_01965 [Vitreimonas sp.]|nr:hypothetical protein [Vitreimonas sp.]